MTAATVAGRGESVSQLSFDFGAVGSRRIDSAVCIYGRAVSPWIIPGLMVGLLGFGVARGGAVYEAFVEGAKDGFRVAIRIIPYLVAILVAVGMFRASKAMELLIEPLGARDTPIRFTSRSIANGITAPPLGLGSLWHPGVDSLRSSDRSGHLCRFPRKHVPRLNRNHILCSCGLLWRGRDTTDSPFACCWINR